MINQMQGPDREALTRRGSWGFALGAISLLAAPLAGEEAAPSERRAEYAVVVSRATHDDPAWKRVVDALLEKHRERLGATVAIHEGDVGEAREALARIRPRYACFVASPAETTRAFVAAVHRLTRKLDDDPFTDTIWGILTGFDPGNALRIAAHAEPLTVRRVAAGTEVALELCEEGVWFCELEKHKVVRKAPGEKPVEERGPADTTRALVECLNDYRADLFVTSGHATERDWQIGYRYRNGQFRSEGGRLFGLDTEGQRFPVSSPSPKVYLPVGNCLMGHIDGPDAMALAFLNSAGVHQMIGYTVPTWYGYAGWGCLDYFVEQPGRFTLAEAFFANTQALIHRLETYFPEAAGEEPAPGTRARGRIEGTEAARGAGLRAGDGQGLLFDRDVVAFYGDPAWEARMAPGPLAWKQTLTETDGVYTLEIVPLRGERTFQPVNTNGSQRGGRPIVQLLPRRLERIEIIEGAEFSPRIADDFILVPLPQGRAPAEKYRIVLSAATGDGTRL